MSFGNKKRFELFISTNFEKLETQGAREFLEALIRNIIFKILQLPRGRGFWTSTMILHQHNCSFRQFTGQGFYRKIFFKKSHSSINKNLYIR